eukprot:3589695-Rhodomonas_salina.2
MALAQLEADDPTTSLSTDGTGPMESLDVSAITLMWGALWEGSTGVTDHYRAIAFTFFRRYETLGLVTNVDVKVHTAWMLACMEPAQDLLAMDVHEHAVRTLKETTPPTELFARYIRESAFSCYWHCMQAMLDEFDETMDIGDDTCIGMCVLNMKRNPPDVGTRR